METTDKHTVWMYAVAALLVVMVLGLCCWPRDANTELARTAREAIALAQDACDADRSAVLWTDRFRLLAIVAGVGVPLIVAYLIWRSDANSALDPTELFETLESRLLPPTEPLTGQPTARQLPPSAPPPAASKRLTQTDDEQAINTPG